MNDKKKTEKLRALLETRFYMTMGEYNTDDVLNKKSRSSIYDDLVDYYYGDDEFSIRIYRLPSLLQKPISAGPVMVIFTDLKLEKLAKQEAEGKNELQLSMEHNLKAAQQE